MTDQRQDLLQRNPRTDKTAREYCYACGTPWFPEWIICESCGGSERETGAARPRISVKEDKVRFPGPWKLLPWPGQGGVAIHGGPGAGKSTLASLIRPKLWLTSEQEPKPVGEMMRRATPDNLCEVRPVKTPEEVAEALRNMERGPIVLDSLTGFGLREALVVAHMISNWARARNDRILAILQHNKGGDAAGYNEIPHLFDAICDLTPDPWGVRAFRVTKSRWSSLGTLYWTFDQNGQIVLPDFPAAYSVEGTAGNYWLHPYPVKGSKWSGLLAFLDEIDMLRSKTASSAVFAGYMESGFVEPMDHHERKRFAQSNGLTWLDPTDFTEAVQQHRNNEKSEEST